MSAVHAFRRLIAEGGGRRLGVGQVENSHLRPRRNFRLSLAVHPAARRRAAWARRWSRQTPFPRRRDRLGGLRLFTLADVGVG
ncbi:MAG TPA: hypothetical protein VNN19_07790, partial [bacterium]|nr:hypothetical protein [bacterium]